MLNSKQMVDYKLFDELGSLQSLPVIRPLTVSTKIHGHKIWQKSISI